MNTSCYPPLAAFPLELSQGEWQDPKMVIRTLFVNVDVADAKGDLDTWLKKAFSYKTLPRRKLAAVHHLYEEMLRLLEAGSLIEKSEQSVLPTNCDWMDLRWWVGRTHQGWRPFDYFPRHLRPKEYYNPYTVFMTCQSAYTLPEWRLLLRNCWLAGLETDRFDELHDAENSFRAYRLLPKLLEAAYLIYVRELQMPPS